MSIKRIIFAIVVILAVAAPAASASSFDLGAYRPHKGEISECADACDVNTPQTLHYVIRKRGQHSVKVATLSVWLPPAARPSDVHIRVSHLRCLLLQPNPDQPNYTCVFRRLPAGNLARRVTLSFVANAKVMGGVVNFGWLHLPGDKHPGNDEAPDGSDNVI